MTSRLHAEGRDPHFGARRGGRRKGSLSPDWLPAECSVGEGVDQELPGGV